MIIKIARLDAWRRLGGDTSMTHRKVHQMIYRFLHHDGFAKDQQQSTGYGWGLIAASLVAGFIVLSNLGIAS
jgi:hypothetical protein